MSEGNNDPFSISPGGCPVKQDGSSGATGGGGGSGGGWMRSWFGGAASSIPHAGAPPGPFVPDENNAGGGCPVKHSRGLMVAPGASSQVSVPSSVEEAAASKEERRRESGGWRSREREIAGGKTTLQIGHNRALSDLNPEVGSRALA